MTSHMRKKDTGEQGNGGQFGSTRRSEADVAIVDSGATREILLPAEVRTRLDRSNYFDLKAFRLADGQLRVEGRSSKISDSLEDEDVDATALCEQISLAYPDADPRIEDTGRDIHPWSDVTFNVTISPDDTSSDAIVDAFADHPLNDHDAPSGVWQKAVRASCRKRAANEIARLGELSRTRGESTASARARAARELYREAATDEPVRRSMACARSAPATARRS